MDWHWVYKRWKTHNLKMSKVVLVATTTPDGRLLCDVDVEREVERKLEDIVGHTDYFDAICIVVGSSTWLAARNVLEKFKLATILVLTKQTNRRRYNIPHFILSDTTLQPCQDFAWTYVLGGKKTFTTLLRKSPFKSFDDILYMLHNLHFGSPFKTCFLGLFACMYDR